MPSLSLPSSIGNGMQFVCKFLSSKLSAKSDSMKPLLDYLLALNHHGEVRIWKQKKMCTYLWQLSKLKVWLFAISTLTLQKLMINNTLDTVNKLQTSLLLAEVFVSALPKNTPFQKFEQRSFCYLSWTRLRWRGKKVKTCTLFTCFLCLTDFRSGDWRKDGVILLEVSRRACTVCLRFFKHQIMWIWRNSSAEFLPSSALWSSLPMAISDKLMFLACLILVGRYRIQYTNEGNKLEKFWMIFSKLFFCCRLFTSWIK